MKKIIIAGIICSFAGFGIGYFLNVREANHYVHVIQVNGTIIKGDFKSIDPSDLKKLNELVYLEKGANHKILQIRLINPSEVKVRIGVYDDHKPRPYQNAQYTALAKKDSGNWRITETSIYTMIQ